MYAGITPADKPALEAAKAAGAEWIARDENYVLGEFIEKPEKTRCYWMGKSFDENWGVDDDDVLKFVKWSDADPVHIDTALAQIAEMERVKAMEDYLPTASDDARAAVFPTYFTTKANEQPPLTVADTIKGMSVEEMADVCCKGCPPSNIVGECAIHKTCKECWTVYLNHAYTKEDENER